MQLRTALLGTTAILGAAALAVPSTASAFDVNINGFMNFNAVGGDNKNALGQSASSFDFVTDTEIHVQGVQVDDETGIRYGMTVEFEADATTSSNNPVDENYIFVQGGFGDLRFGNEDGAVDNMKLGAYVIAAGTGGIDGQDVVASVQFAPTNSGDSSKAIYYSPTIAGFQLGVSFTPNGGVEGNQVANTTDPEYDNWVEAGLVYTGAFGGIDVRASAVGGAANGINGGDDLTTWNLGAVVGLYGFNLAGSFWHDDDGPNGDTTGYTAGASAALGPADVSINWADITDADDNEEGNNLVLSASMGLLPGLSLHGDVSWFDRDAGGDDDGVTGVGRLRVAF